MTKTKPSSVRFSISDNIGRITIARPQVANALDWRAITELAAATKAAKASSARMVFIHGEGKHFCAGADAAWLATKRTKAQSIKQAKVFAETLRALYQMPKPLIALVQGACYGGGIGLAAVADMCFADASAKFSFGEVRLGIVPAVISPYIVAAIGARAARRFVVSGEVMDAKTAARLGLAHEVVNNLSKAETMLIKQLQQNAPGAMAKAKTLIDEVANQPINSALSSKTAMLLAAANNSAEGREGLNAFLQKRKPKWAE